MYVIPHPALPVTPPSSSDSTVTNWASKATCWKIEIYSKNMEMQREWSIDQPSALQDGKVWGCQMHSI